MEPFPYHYARRSRAKESADPTIRFVLEELQRMEPWLGNRIEGALR
jgi:hypothetical protein